MVSFESDGWWSRPPQDMPSSARVLFDGSPAALWLVEDDLGYEDAESVKLTVPEKASVFEIEGAPDWGELCSRFPRDVPERKRDDWSRLTGRSHRWVTPDWVRVAEHYAGVHLQVGAYLTAAGVAIPIDGSASRASVIAGWNPDETYWFSSDVRYGDERMRWKLKGDSADLEWQPVSSRNP